MFLVRSLWSIIRHSVQRARPHVCAQRNKTLPVSTLFESLQPNQGPAEAYEKVSSRVSSTKRNVFFLRQEMCIRQKPKYCCLIHQKQIPTKAASEQNEKNYEEEQKEEENRTLYHIPYCLSFLSFLYSIYIQIHFVLLLHRRVNFWDIIKLYAYIIRCSQSWGSDSDDHGLQ